MHAWKNERGGVLVFVAVTLLVMLMCVALAINIGWMALARNQGQRSVDAAALAGIGGLQKYNATGSDDQIVARSTAFNGSNTVITQDASIEAGDIEPILYNRFTNTVTLAPEYWEANGVQVTRTYPISLFFGRVLNDGQPVSTYVTATAVIRYHGTLPILLYCTPAEYLMYQQGLAAGQLVGACPRVFDDTNPANNMDPKTGEYVNSTYDIGAGYNEAAWTNFFSTSSANPDDLIDMVTGDIPIPAVFAGDEIQLSNAQGGVMGAVYDMWVANGKDWIVLLPVVDGTYGISSGSNEESVMGFVPVRIVDVVDPGTCTSGSCPGPTETFTIEPVLGTAWLDACICTTPILVR